MQVNETRLILSAVGQQTFNYRQTRHHKLSHTTGHVLRYDGLLHEIIEGRMKGKPTRGRRRIKMLHDLTMMVALLHSNGQLRTDRDGDRSGGEFNGLLWPFW